MTDRFVLERFAWLGVVLVASGLIVPSKFANAKGDLPVEWDETQSGAPIDLSNYRIVFEEEFDERALRGPKVFAPVHSPFGAGSFDGPNGKAYDIVNGTLTLTAYTRNKKWRSGSVQTADAAQSDGRIPFSEKRGFSCDTCYFETRMRFPKDKVPGLWAAFWLLSPEGPNGHVEIDVIEWYGSDPKGHHQSVHIWPKDRASHAGQSNYTGMSATTDGDWHTYGAQHRGGTVHIYMDRKEISRVKVPTEFDSVYYAVATLAVLQKEAKLAREPFSIAVDYIRAYIDQ